MTRAQIIRTPSELREKVGSLRLRAKRVGLVPTMGALHDGHLSLIEAAKSSCDALIVSIFVNPKQFNNAEDLALYPRNLEGDLAKMAPFDVDLVYIPEPEAIYPAGFATKVSVEGLPDILCGAHRPGHFDGVATIVSKLFIQTAPDMAFFGEKDFQQLQIIRRMTLDLDLPLEVIGCPTLREQNGLALSSRNQRLSSADRDRASALYKGLNRGAAALRQGERFEEVEPKLRAELAEAGFGEVEYFELRASEDLALLSRAEPGARLFIAAWLEGVRLIDNILVQEA